MWPGEQSQSVNSQENLVLLANIEAMINGKAVLLQRGCGDMQMDRNPLLAIAMVHQVEDRPLLWCERSTRDRGQVVPALLKTLLYHPGLFSGVQKATTQRGQRLRHGPGKDGVPVLVMQHEQRSVGDLLKLDRKSGCQSGRKLGREGHCSLPLIEQIGLLEGNLGDLQTQMMYIVSLFKQCFANRE